MCRCVLTKCTELGAAAKKIVAMKTLGLRFATCYKQASKLLLPFRMFLFHRLHPCRKSSVHHHQEDLGLFSPKKTFLVCFLQFAIKGPMDLASVHCLAPAVWIVLQREHAGKNQTL